LNVWKVTRSHVGRRRPSAARRSVRPEPRRDGGNEHIPANVPAGPRRTRSTESFAEDLQVGDVRDVAPAPSVGSAGSAFAAHLVKEESTDAVDDPIVVRFADPPPAVKSEAHEPSRPDRVAQQLISTGEFTHDLHISSSNRKTGRLHDPRRLDEVVLLVDDDDAPGVHQAVRHEADHGRRDDDPIQIERVARFHETP